MECLLLVDPRTAIKQFSRLVYNIVHSSAPHIQVDLLDSVSRWDRKHSQNYLIISLSLSRICPPFCSRCTVPVNTSNASQKWCFSLLWNWSVSKDVAITIVVARSCAVAFNPDKLSLFPWTDFFILPQTSPLNPCFWPTDEMALDFFTEISSYSDKPISTAFFHGWYLIPQ